MDQNPIINVQISVILNCIGIARHVKLKLHKNTIPELVSLETLNKMFIQQADSDKNEQNEVKFMLLNLTKYKLNLIFFYF